MDLNEVAVFIRVLQTGSFSRAAQHLGMPKSTVSMKVASLEARLGVTLLKRTTRKLHVTPAGQDYFRRVTRGLEEIQNAENELLATQSEPQGLLKITAPVELGNGVLPDLVSAFLKRYPKVTVEILLADRLVDLLAEGIDLAIRAGHLKDSSFIAKRVGEGRFGLFASPRYLKAHGTPSHPKALKEHDFIRFSAISGDELKMESAKGKATAVVPARLQVNDLNLAKRFALCGDGIASLPTFLCYSEVKSGQLVHVLPEWRSNVNPVHFVYPAQKFVQPALAAFIELSTEPLREHLRSEFF